MRGEPANKEQLKDLRSKLYAQEKEREKTSSTRLDTQNMIQDTHDEKLQEEEEMDWGL